MVAKAGKHLKVRKKDIVDSLLDIDTLLGSKDRPAGGPRSCVTAPFPVALAGDSRDTLAVHQVDANPAPIAHPRLVGFTGNVRALDGSFAPLPVAIRGTAYLPIIRAN
jgi:hypothetical protein